MNRPIRTVIASDRALNRNISIGLLVIFIIWPFAALIFALSRFGRRDSRLVIFGFLILYGYSFILGNAAMDSTRYAQMLVDTAQKPFSQFWDIVAGIYATETSLDIVLPFLNFVISRFTDNYRVLFAVFAAIFGYFYLKSIDQLYAEYKNTRNYNALIYLIFFASIIPIFYINGFRFWTAAWVFFLGAYRVVLFRDWKYLLLCFFSALIHFSLLSANMILLLYLLIGNRNIIYYPMFAASFFGSTVFSGIVTRVAGFFGEGTLARYERYSNISVIEQLNQQNEAARTQGQWYLYLPSLVIFYYMLIALFFVRYRMKEYGQSEKHMQNLFSFILLFLSFSNFLGSIPSMERFKTISYLFILAYLVHVFSRVQKRNLQFITLLGIFPMALVIIIVIRTGIDTFGPMLFAPMPLPFLENNVTIFQWFFK